MTSAAGNAGGNRRRRRAVVIALSVAVPLAALLVCLSAAVFSGLETVPFRPPTEEDLYLQQRLVRRLMNEVFRKKPKMESQIVLTEQEVESLFRLADCGLTAAKRAGRYPGPLPRTFRPVFRKGRLRLVCPFDTGCRLLFGGVLKIRLSVTPELDDTRLVLTLHSCRAGMIPLPASAAEKILDQLADTVRTSEEYALFCGIVKKVSMTKEGNVLIVYRPARVLPLLLGNV
ncbi:MAG: hypothetical protein IJS01_11830 [Lentisphaeria bacterium]|nr:hypothetical protein [Lentisphaeria bacterium]